jgi:PncC family amidohydrolase
MAEASQLEACCRQVAEQLSGAGLRIVFAESCTAGLLSSSLGAIPGASSLLCGSLVVYREASKQQWLGVTADQLSRYTAVSEVVARQMVVGALAATPEADLAVSITGHLGPDAPAEQDGLVFLGIGRRSPAEGPVEPPRVRQLRLSAAERGVRRTEAALAAFELLSETLRTDAW